MWGCYPPSPYATDKLSTLLLPAASLLLASVAWTLHPQTGVRLPSREASASSDGWALGIVLLASGGGGIVAISIVANQHITGSSNTSWYSPFVLVLCYALALAMPIHAALSEHTIRHRPLHIATGIVGLLLFAAFVGFLYGTNYDGGYWSYCLLAAVLLQGFILLSALTRLVADWNASADGKMISTAWLALVVGMSVNLFVQFACGFVVAVMVRPNAATMEDYETQVYELLTSPSIFLAIVVLSQASLFAVVMMAARLSPLPTRQRLALLPVAWNVWRWGIVIASCLFPMGVGVILLEIMSLVVAPDPTLETVLRKLSPAQWWLYLLVIALLPGFVEELLFRGYFQSRLQLRWQPGWCVALSGVLFGLFHIHPHAILFAIVVGLWLAYIAYCSGSTWPTIACHVAINAWMTLLSYLAIYNDIDSGVVIGVILVLAGLVPFVVSLRWLNGMSKPMGNHDLLAA